MTRPSAHSSLPIRPAVAQKVLCSTSGNAHHNKHEHSGSEQNGAGPPFTAPRVAISSRNNNNLAQTVIVDKKGQKRHVWRKVPGSLGVPEQFMEYLEEVEIQDLHGRKHKVWERSGLLSNAELHSPKYLTYRAKTQKCLSKVDGLPVWPDDLEAVFQFLIRKIPSMAKKKILYRGKICGRNEIISGEIKALTGYIRSRKQVSSHFQVLKNMFPKGSAWLELVTYDEKATTERGASYFDAEKGEMLFSRPLGKAQNNKAAKEDEFDFNALPPAPLNSRVSGGCFVCPSVQRIEFDMRIHAPHGMDIIHSYTKIQSEMGAPPRCLEDVVDWRAIYPDLAKIHYEQGLVNDEIVLLETNFELPDGFPPASSKLGIHLFAEMMCDPSYSKWSYCSRFYEQGKFKLECSQRLKTSHITRTNRTKIEEIPLESSWWINVFHKIAQRRQEVVAKGDAQAIRQEEEDARRYIREVSVMQEILATSASDGCQKRVAILLWKFRQTRGNEAAITTWRRITPPPPNVTITSPRPLKPQPPMRLDIDLLSGHELQAHQYPMPPEVSSFLDSFPDSQDMENPFGQFMPQIRSNADDYYRLASLADGPTENGPYGHPTILPNVQEPESSNHRIDLLDGVQEDDFSSTLDHGQILLKELGMDFDPPKQTTVLSIHAENENKSDYKFQIVQSIRNWPLQHTSSLKSEDLDRHGDIGQLIEEFHNPSSAAFDYSTPAYDNLLHASFTNDTNVFAEFDSECATVYTRTNSTGHITDQNTSNPSSYAGDFYGGEIQLRLEAGHQLDVASVFDPAILESMNNVPHDQAYTSSQEYSSSNHNHNHNPYAPPHQSLPDTASMHQDHYLRQPRLLPSSTDIPADQVFTHNNKIQPCHPHHNSPSTTLSPSTASTSCDTPWETQFPPEFFIDMRFEHPDVHEGEEGERGEEEQALFASEGSVVMGWEIDHVPRVIMIGMGDDGGTGVDTATGAGGSDDGDGRVLGEVIEDMDLGVLDRGGEVGGR